MATDVIQEQAGSSIINDIWAKFQSGDVVSNEWSSKRDEILKEQLNNIRNEKKKRKAEDEEEVEQLLTLKLPFEYLAKDWFNEKEISLEDRIYLLEKLIPTLVMGVEKLLIEAEKKDLIEENEMGPSFNPINFLAQYLMRNNPRYSNFANASPYAKSICTMLEKLKKDAYDLDDNNRLAQLKEKVEKHKTEINEVERKKQWLNKSRPKILQNMFVEWAGVRNSVISLSLVQSALRSFQDFAVSLPIETQRGSMFSLKNIETDQTGKLINIREFVEYLLSHLQHLSETSFNTFIEHMSSLAIEYRASIELEGLRTIISNLFLLCDFGETGLVDRQRILKLLNLFYDDAAEPEIKSTLRNPRKWPVVEFEEEEDEVEKYIQEHGLEKAEVDEEASQEQPSSTDANIAATESKDDKDNKKDNDATISDAKNGEKSAEKAKSKNVHEQQMEAFVHGQVATELTHIDEKGVPHFTCTKQAAVEADIKAIMDSASKLSVDSLPGVSRPHSVCVVHSFNTSTLTQSQFVNLLMTFLGDVPKRKAVEVLVRFVRTGYVETEDEREKRIDKIKKDAENIKRRVQTEQLFDIWDVDGSGYLEINEVEMVLSKWREEDIHDYLLKEACHVFEDVFTKITRKSFKKLIDKICAVFPDEDVFDSLIQFLTRSVQRSFEERKRGDYRKKWLQSIDMAARTAGGLLDPLFKAAFQVVTLDAQKHGKDKKASVYVALLEANRSKIATVKGQSVLRYVACTPTDTDLVLNKILHRGMKNISFVAVDSGKPIHVPRVLNHPSVHLWNTHRREEKVEGSFICLPLKDYEKKVVGVLGIDTLIDPHDKALFVQHEISFYQGVSKALSNGLQHIDSRMNTIKIAESAVSWILRRSPNVQEVVIYLVEPNIKAGEEGAVVRRMVTLGHNQVYIKEDIPPRMERKDNLFRDYLFKCIDTSETLTADAYGERHLAFPLRDADGLVIIIVDISIGKMKQLPPHELDEVQRMLKLLEMAQKEITCEAAGEDKNMVLEVEKEHATHRIEVLFDRIMLQDLRANVGRLDSRAFAEIKSYKDPPKIIHNILNAVLGLYLNESDDEEVLQKLDEWTTAKQHINTELIKWLTNFDPTAGDIYGNGATRLTHYLKDITPGQVGKDGSLPAQYLFNWAFVCMSLIEHTGKMRAIRAVQIEHDSKRNDSAVNPTKERKAKQDIVEEQS